MFAHFTNYSPLKSEQDSCFYINLMHWLYTRCKSHESEQMKEFDEDEQQVVKLVPSDFRPLRF